MGWFGWTVPQSGQDACLDSVTMRFAAGSDYFHQWQESPRVIPLTGPAQPSAACQQAHDDPDVQDSHALTVTGVWLHSVWAVVDRPQGSVLLQCSIASCHCSHSVLRDACVPPHSNSRPYCLCGQRPLHQCGLCCCSAVTVVQRAAVLHQRTCVHLT